MAIGKADHETITYIGRHRRLQALQYYHTCNFGLPPDAMHNLLEGYVKLCTNLLLKQLIEINKYFKLTDLLFKILSIAHQKQNLSQPPLLPKRCQRNM